MSAVWAWESEEPTGMTRFRRKWFGLGSMVHEYEFIVTQWDTNCPRMSERKIRVWREQHRNDDAI